MSVATICDAGNTVMFKKDCTEAVKRRHDGGKHNVPHDREIPRVGFCEAGMRSNGQHTSEVSFLPVRPMEMAVGGVEDEDLEEIKCGNKARRRSETSTHPSRPGSPIFRKCNNRT